MSPSFSSPMLVEIVTLAVLFIASYTDVRTREIPDWVSYSFIAGILGIQAILSLRLGWAHLLFSLLGLVLMIALAYGLYYAGLWGGGDSKILMGMGAVFGFHVNLLLFFVALLFAGAVWGLGWMGMVAARNRNAVWSAFRKQLQKTRTTHLSMVLLMAVCVVLTFFNSLFWVLIPLPLGLFYLFLVVDIVEQVGFIKKVPLSKVTEGDWLAEDILLRGKTLSARKTLEREDLQLLKDHHIHHVLIKYGVPFMPAFLVAYLLVVLGGKYFTWKLFF